MVRHTQTIRRSGVELAINGLRINSVFTSEQCRQYSLYSVTKNSIKINLSQTQIASFVRTF